MNIFVLDLDPVVCARYHCDIHVGVMAKEARQLLASAHHRLNPRSHTIKGLPKPTHMNHPCAVWVRESSANYYWLFDLYQALHQEFMFRFGKAHGNYTRIDAVDTCPRALEYRDMTPFAQAMPDKYKDDDPGASLNEALLLAVLAYRNYYRNDKQAFHKWTRREVPEWITSNN